MAQLRQRYPEEARCDNCQLARPYIDWLCAACWQYKLRTGRDRPDWLFERKKQTRVARKEENE